MARKRKDKTIAGQRIPLALYLRARKIQDMMAREGKKYSLQDAYRRMAKRSFY